VRNLEPHPKLKPDPLGFPFEMMRRLNRQHCGCAKLTARSAFLMTTIGWHKVTGYNKKHVILIAMSYIR